MQRQELERNSQYMDRSSGIFQNGSLQQAFVRAKVSDVHFSVVDTLIPSNTDNATQATRAKQPGTMFHNHTTLWGAP